MLEGQRQSRRLKNRPQLPSRWGRFAFMLTTLTTLGACGSSVQSTQFVSTQRVFQASFDPELLRQYPVDLDFYAIDPEGKRSPLKDVTWSSEDGRLSFIVHDRDFYPIDTSTPLDTVFAMGGEVPAFTAGGFAQQIIGQLRIEARPKVIPAEHALVPYSQFILPLTRLGSLNTSDAMVLESGAALEVVGASRVRIYDPEGTPIPEAQVVVYPHGEIQLTDGQIKPIWHSPLHRPIATSTDDRGFADLLPLVPAGRFQIFVQAEGYCSYMSEEFVFDPKIAIAPDITLSPCEQLSNDMSFQAAWNPQVVSFGDKRLDGSTYATAYTNQDTIEINLQNTSKVLRPMRVTVLEEPNERAEPCVYEGYPQTLKSFTSRLSVKLPVQFYEGFCNAPTRTAAGSFTVKLEALDEKGEVIHTQILYGKKSTSVPPTVEADKVTLANPIGLTNVISGRTGGTFTVNSLIFCKPRRQLGLRVLGTQDITYRPCNDDFEADFTVEQLKIPETAGGLGQSIALEVFIKDEYSNVSVNDESVNRLNLSSNVFVDFGLPDIEEIRGRFTTHFGFANRAMTTGLPEGIIVNSSPVTTDTAVLRAASLGDFVFRFESSTSCATIGSSADGGGSPRTGAAIHAFVIGPTADAVNAVAPASFQTCTQSGAPRNFTLKAGDLAFPNNPASPLEFFMRVMDRAGNISVARSFTIPPCPTNIETLTTNPPTPVCWRP